MAAGPRAVVWDCYFRSSRPQDEELAASILELEQVGVPVVVAALSYRADGTPELSEVLTERLQGRLRHGAIIARDMVDRPESGEFVLVYQRGDGTLVPSLVLVTVAAVLHPATSSVLEWRERERERWVELFYQVEPGAYLRGRDRIELNTIYQTAQAQNGVDIGDLIGCGTFALAPPEEWEGRTGAL